MGLLGSEPRHLSRIGLKVRFSASFQIFALRMLLHSAEVTSGGFSLGVIFEDVSSTLKIQLDDLLETPGHLIES